MMLSDRVAVMREGRIVQLGSPDEIYHHPNTPFVAHFLGETNLLSCPQWSLELRSAVVTFADGTKGAARRPAQVPRSALHAQVSVRPERIELLDRGERRDNQAEAVITKRTFLGSQTRYTVDALGGTLVVTVPDGTYPQLSVGDRCRVAWAREDAHLLSSSDDKDPTLTSLVASDGAASHNMSHAGALGGQL